MEEIGDPHFKRERPASYGQPPSLPMPPTEAPHLHTYPHPAPQGAPMHPHWNPAPSPYHDGHDHRPIPDGPPPHHVPHSYPPPQNYGPPPHSQTPTYPPDPGYSRQNSVSGPTRSPPSAQPSHYSTTVNGAPHPSEAYYPPPPADYRSRQSYPPPESPASAQPQPVLHVQTTNHEIMPTQPQHQGPPPGYPPPPSSGPPPTPGYWPPPPHADWYQQQRRKPVRAAQACDSCRQRKAKCDEGRPECTHCKENSLRCTYRDVPPQKSEKQMLHMTEKVDGLASQLESYIRSTDDKLNAVDEKLDNLIASVQLIASQRSVSDSRPEASIPMTKTRSRPQTKEEPRSNSSAQLHRHDFINAPFMQGGMVDANAAVHVYTASTPKQRGPMGASDLLMWPSIQDLAPKDIASTYVMDGEAQRGLLRLYGCGEGEDKGDGHDGAPSPAASNNSSGRMDEDGTNSSPSGVWGTGQLPHREGNHQPVYDHPGGVTPGGQLLLDRTAVDGHVKSYLEHMHILHPFLDARVLRKMVHTFKLKYSWDFPSVPRLAHNVITGTKRKRDTSESPNSTADVLHAVPPHNGVRSGLPQSQIEHSVSNAIVLLVIALGKICAYEKPLPGPPKSSSVTSNSRVPQQQPLLGYGDFPPSSSAPTSPYTGSHINGVPSGSTVSGLQGKNMDVIPGLAYFAKAADILGELPGGVDVSHIQANLLAGLYMGQIARIIPSHWYINNACRAVQILIRSAEYREKRMSEERRNLINFAFWSCLQLESDILAEMDIPPSGIVAREADMLLEVPSALTIGTADVEREKEEVSSNPREAYRREQNIIHRHYSNQIQLRRTINDAVHNVYSNTREPSDGKPPQLITTLDENLENWRSLLEHGWNWEDEEHESQDINHARMRGKYYGAKYIINRPALHYALSLAHPATPMSRPSESPLGGSSHSENTSPAVSHHVSSLATYRRVNEMRPPLSRSVENLEPWIRDACERCIHAAIKSTTAFDRVPPRLVVTSILSTAHAQFGNVLVLAGTFNSTSPFLKSLVPEEILRFLLTRTIRFLDDKAPISPALEEDARILRFVQGKLFPLRTGTTSQPHISSANSSFSSNR
ncbi:hypothetical protein LTS08_005790 [Lithohypha guttulata]|uniref:uncharacterized protein n=1 Tax=Lithohypha guttulata TaxID=1690604 RepID=UPI002DDF86F1|nr:hypothetical protein LTR51_002303 [Lithohypha guttulata]KAK5099210.1 hypothetical protein LTS08_005790 [Lithohypha guttulata]